MNGAFLPLKTSQITVLARQSEAQRHTTPHNAQTAAFSVIQVLGVRLWKLNQFPIDHRHLGQVKQTHTRMEPQTSAPVYLMHQITHDGEAHASHPSPRKCGTLRGRRGSWDRLSSILVAPPRSSRHG